MGLAFVRCMEWPNQLTIGADELASLFGIHITTVYRNPELRRLQRKIGRRVLWEVADVKRWFQGQQEVASANQDFTQR